MNKKNYNNITEVTVKSQEELDAVPSDFRGNVYIKFGTADTPAIVRRRYYRIIALGNSSVEARNNASVEAWENASVEALGNASVVAWGDASVVARNNASVLARNNASVEALGNASVEARGNASVEAWENASVIALDNASVVAWDHTSVTAWDNASVVAWGDASVVALGNASVEARGKASVDALGNSQIVDRLNGGRIKIAANARIVHMPKTIHEFMDFYGVKHDNETAVFYKAVHKKRDKYFSDHQPDFIYSIGGVVKETCDPDVNRECSFGIHIAHLDWALSFGESWEDLAILEVKTKIKDIVMPDGTDGKVRTCECTVLREIPLSECGIFGKILDKRKNK